VAASDSAPLHQVTTNGGHLAEVAVIVGHAVRSPDPILDAACGHLVRAGGKGFRPLVTVLAATAIGQVSARTHAAAASCELLHLSTLYHDDVIDAAELRRGVASVNRVWGERVAVQAGNRLTALALEVAGRAGDDIPAVVASTYRQLVEGERRESQLVGRTDHGLADYFEVIDGKTASLIAASARVGALSTEAPVEQVDALTAWGRMVGRAYQLADDLLDLITTSEITGKPAGNDVRQGVFTLPLLDALSGADGDELRTLLAPGAPYPRDTVERVVALVHTSGAIARTAARVERLLERADEQLTALPPHPARVALRELARSVVPDVPRVPPTTADPSTPAPVGGVIGRGAPVPGDGRFPAFEPEPA
jgi:heptaprenyl diphosphate synthase